MSPAQMPEWKRICKTFADTHNAELLFVNEQSCGVQYNNTGAFHHIYIEDMQEILKREDRT